MQQLVLHVMKSLKTTEEILLDAQMEIVFKSKRAEIAFSELTPEEQKSWQEFQGEQIISNFSSLSNNIEAGKETLTFLNDAYVTLENIAKMYGTPGNLENAKKQVENCIKKHSKLKNYFGYHRVIDLLEYQLPSLLNSTEVSCSCIIAKKGDNFVRYIRFLQNEDPIITISGSESEQLASVLKDA